VRTALARQVLAIGVEPLWFVGAVAVFVGISVVVQSARDQRRHPPGGRRSSRVGNTNAGLEARTGAVD
jgi:hypothetical protein